MMKQLRKLLLLMSAAIALAAFTGPAIAHAEGPFWYVNGEKVEGSVSFSAPGSLTFKDPLTESFTFVVGPCGMAFQGTLTNGEEAAEGDVESAMVFSSCATNVAGCEALTFPGSMPWPIVATETEVSWQKTAFGGHFTGCGSIGIPNKSNISWGGTLNGQWNNETGCLEYIDAGELYVPSYEDDLFTDGVYCPVVEGGELTLE